MNKSVKIPQPHFDWGQPTLNQINQLKAYIDAGGSMSIYGDDGIYKKLETWIGKYYNSRYVILTNTGTSSLNSAFVGLSIQPGNEVIVPTYTFLATVTPLLRIGAVPVFADADHETGNISPISIESKITSKTVAIILTHMWGVACDMEAIMKIAKNYNLKVLEDCSHAHFTRHKNKLLGTYGDVACFSIGAKKTLTSGEGGFMLTNDPEIYLRATLLGHFELRSYEAIDKVRNDGFIDLANKYSGFETGFGENYRIHPYSAIMAYALLNSGEIFELIKKRESSLRYFHEQLDKIKIISTPKFDDEFYTGAMYGYKPRINYELTCLSATEIVSMLSKLNLKIKMPDSTPLHKKAIFTRITDMGLGYKCNFEIGNDFQGIDIYMDGRVSMPTFTAGIDKDKILIDEYIRVLENFEKEIM